MFWMCGNGTLVEGNYDITVLAGWGCCLGGGG